jgi:hypothetical protein
VNYSDPFGLAIEFRGERADELRAAFESAMAALKFAAKDGDKQAAFYYRALNGLFNSRTRTVVIESGANSFGRIGETDPNTGNHIQIDFANLAREESAGRTRLDLIVAHELGHSLGIGWGRRGTGESVEVEQRIRNARGNCPKTQHEGRHPPLRPPCQ